MVFVERRGLARVGDAVDCGPLLGEDSEDVITGMQISNEVDMECQNSESMW